jgi:opacity protein-like surface antigen
MKKIIALTLIALLFTTVKSQENQFPDLKRKFELSPGFSFQYIQNMFMINIPMRLNYFVSNKLSFGTEVMATFSEDFGDAGIIFNLLMEADFPQGDKAFPFITAGYGISNGALPIDRLAIKDYSTKKLGVLNLGVGLKIPLTSKILARTDLRYQHFHGKEKYNFYYEGYDPKIRVGTFNATFGISFLL